MLTWDVQLRDEEDDDEVDSSESVSWLATFCALNCLLAAMVDLLPDDAARGDDGSATCCSSSSAFCFFRAMLTDDLSPWL